MSVTEPMSVTEQMSVAAQVSVTEQASVAEQVFGFLNAARTPPRWRSSWSP